MIQLAKETLFDTPNLYRKALAESPMTTTRTLLRLVEALGTATLPEPPAVYDSELYLLTAKVIMEIGRHEPAVELLNGASRFSRPVWKVRMLSQLIECHRKLGEDGTKVAQWRSTRLDLSGGM